MKHRSIIVGTVAIAALAMSTPSDAIGANGTTPSNNSAAPQLKHAGSIKVRDLGSSAWVQILSFSPDSRYLAIGDTPTAASSAIVVWDLQLDREQTRITELPPFAGRPQVGIEWSPDGKSITFGTGTPIRFWDPLTGRVVKELADEPPHLWARYNKDGSKLLINREPLGGGGSFRIYDTRTWQFRDYGDDGLHIQALSWTSDDYVLVAGEWPKVSAGRTLDGLVPQTADTLMRLIDPSGRQPARAALLAQALSNDVTGVGHPIPVQNFWIDAATVNYPTDKIAIGPGKIVDARTLKVLTYATDEDITSHKIPIGDRAFSSNGNFLYLLGSNKEGTEKSVVMNTLTGTPIATFTGGHNGLAASPDGKRLAIGNGQSVDLYDVQ